MALYITGSKIDQIYRTFFMFFARMKVNFNETSALESHASEEASEEGVPPADLEESPGAPPIDSPSSSDDSSSETSSSDEQEEEEKKDDG